MGFRRVALIFALLVSFSIGAAHAQQSTKGGITSIQQEPLKEWLTYIASDELQGRATYSEGLGLAAGYISSHLAQWGVKPAGDHGTYLQVVKVLGVRTTSRATVTVEVNGQSRTFNDGDGITFPKEMGGKQTVVADRVQFAGYGLTLPSGTHDDYAKRRSGRQIARRHGRRLAGPAGPKSSESGLFRLLSPYARNRAAIAKGAVATIAPPGLRFRSAAAAAPRQRLEARPPLQPAPPAAGSGRGRGGAVDDGDFTTVAAVRRQGSASRHSRRRVLRVPLQRIAGQVRRAQGEGGQAGTAAAISSLRASRSRSTSTPTTRSSAPASPTTSSASSRAAIRSCKTPTWLYGAHYDHFGYREGVVGAGRGGQRSQSRRSDQQRRRRRRIRHGGDHVDRARVRARSEARSARSSSSGMPAKRPVCSDRATTPTIRSFRSTRSSRS